MQDTKDKWSTFFDNWKMFIRNPNISVYEKVIVYDVFLYRSDNEGWCISERKMANDLGIAKETASKYIDSAIKRGFLLASTNIERKRRKLRLSGKLRSPDWARKKPKKWARKKPSKYQYKYQDNTKNETKVSFKREIPLENILTPKEIHKHVSRLKEIGLKQEKKNHEATK